MLLGEIHPAVSETVVHGESYLMIGGTLAVIAIARLMIATNVNDILARVMQAGIYETEEVIATSSPSMDIQVSSNFERL